MWGNANTTYVERTLEDIKNAVIPMSRAVTELEAQTKNLKEGLERSFKEIEALHMKTDSIQTELHTAISATETAAHRSIEDMGKRLNEVETVISETKGAVNFSRWMFSAVGAGIFGLVISGGIWLHNEAYANRERVAVIEKEIDTVQGEIRDILGKFNELYNRRR